MVLTKVWFSLPIFHHQAGYAGKFTGVVGDDNQAVSAGDGGDLEVVRTDGFALAGQRGADFAKMLGGVIAKRQAGEISKESAQAGLILSHSLAFAGAEP